MVFSDLFSKVKVTFAGSHRLPVTLPTDVGLNVSMVQRPVLGVGNAPQYWPDMQLIPFSAITGGGTMPTQGPPMPTGGPLLDWQTHTFGGPTQVGTITPSRQLVGLADSKTIGERR